MYICICNNVTESDIHEAVRSGARTLDCLADRLAVSTCCGQCRCFADECLRTALHTVQGAAAVRDPAARACDGGTSEPRHWGFLQA